MSGWTGERGGERARDTAFFLLQRHKLLPAEPVFPSPHAVLVALESLKDGWSIWMEVIRLCLTSLSICSRCYSCHNMKLWNQTWGGKMKITDMNFFLLPLSVGGDSNKELTCQCKRFKRCGCNPWVGKIPWRRKWQPTSLFLPGEFHGQRSLAAITHGVAKSQTWLKWPSMHTCWLTPYQFIDNLESLPTGQSHATNRLCVIEVRRGDSLTMALNWKAFKTFCKMKV